MAVKDWLDKVNPSEDYILIIDSDTIMREGFDVDELEIRPGEPRCCIRLHATCELCARAFLAAPAAV